VSRILIVDDDEEIVQTLSYNLESAGYRVDIARDGVAGLRLARTGSPDLVLLDLMLPGIDGVEVCRMLRKTSSVPVIMVTARSSEAESERKTFVLQIVQPGLAGLMDGSVSTLAPLFAATRQIATAMETVLDAEGSFVANNNKISQTVPHLHVHVIPRRKGDGLKGFFWPRRGYSGDDHRSEVAAKLRAALQPGSKV